jgi:hypothetical protein
VHRKHQAHAEPVERRKQVLEHLDIIDVTWAMQCHQPVFAFADPERGQDTGCLGALTRGEQRVDHDVADEDCAIGTDALARQVRHPRRLRHEQ